MTSSSNSIMVGLVCTFALGFASAWVIRAPASSDALGDTGSVSAKEQNVRSAAQHSTHDWFTSTGGVGAAPSSLDQQGSNGTRGKDPDQVRMEWQEALVAKAKADPAALRSLIQRYESERDPKQKELLRSVLANVQGPEVLELAARLAASGTLAQRQDAFEILKQLSSGAPEVRQMLRQALATEQAPAVLSQAIAALTPAVVTSSEGEAIVSQLTALSQHADPAVRSQSVLQLAQWDKSAAVEGRLKQALADQASEVRQAAVIAVSEAGVRSDSMKLTLLGIIGNQGESASVKDGALHALQRYSMSKEEFALYQQVRSDVDKRFRQ